MDAVMDEWTGFDGYFCHVGYLQSVSDCSDYRMRANMCMTYGKENGGVPL